MDARKPSPSAGEKLKDLRVRLGLTTRDVETKSLQMRVILYELTGPE